MTDYKKDFPLLAGSDIAYLDNAATAQRGGGIKGSGRFLYKEKCQSAPRAL